MRAYTQFMAFFVLNFMLTSCRNPQGEQWPPIKEVNIRHHFAVAKENEQLKTMIYDREGTPLYCLDARLGGRDYELGDYDFSGALDCRLYPVIESSPYPTLLQNKMHATRDWQTYGRFVREELIGLAGADDSRSVVQRCGVRGMIIEIHVFNVKEREGTIVSLDMFFTARNASSKERPNATGEIAAQNR